MTAFGPRAGGLRLLRWVVVAVAIGLCANTGTSVYLYLKVGRDARVTTAALCTLRHDLESRVESSRAFLAEHPRGIPGISAKVIRDGISNQRRTIHALAGIDCSK